MWHDELPSEQPRRRRHCSFCAALLICGAILSVRAAPVVDPLFGANGIARVASPSGAEETANAAAQLSDGRIVVAGTSRGHQSPLFVIRFTASGALDNSFGKDGVVLLDPKIVSGGVRQVAVENDGSTLVGIQDTTSHSIVRLAMNGNLDPSFGTNGIVSRQVSISSKTVWFVEQPDRRSREQDPQMRVRAGG